MNLSSTHLHCRRAAVLLVSALAATSSAFPVAAQQENETPAPESSGSAGDNSSELTDLVIALAIEADLKEKLGALFLDEDNTVSARVNNGVAFLEGVVDTWLMWQSALDQAIAAGAREPHMMVEVRYAVPQGARYFGPFHYIPR